MASRNRNAQANLIRLQRARQLAGLPTAGFFSSLAGIGKRLIGGGLGFIPGGNILKTAFDIGGGLLGGGGGSRLIPRRDCAPGFVKNTVGQCVRSGLTGMMERAIPGGATGLQPFGPGGLGALVPGGVAPMVEQSQRLLCPRGFVLGLDENCYLKAVLPRKLRKWRPPPRAPITAADMKALRKAERLKGKAKRVAGLAGFSCKTRGGARRKS